MDEEQQFVFLFLHASLKPNNSTYPNGLSVASVAEIAGLLHSLYNGDPDPQESNNLITTADLTALFILHANPSIASTESATVGNVQIECADRVEGWREYTANTYHYTTVDKHFVFYKKRLHMFFTRRHSDYSFTLQGNTFSPLSAVSHAVALGSYSATALQSILYNRNTEPDIFPEQIYYPVNGLSSGANPFALTRRSLYLLRARQAEQQFMERLPEMLLSYRASACDPVFIPEMLGVTDATNSAVQPTSPMFGIALPIAVEVNDPNVYVAEDGTLVMLVHCGALGGIVLLTAPPDTGAALPDPC